MKNLITLVLITISLGCFSQVPNVMHIFVDGGDYGYADNAYVAFIEGATVNYDVEIEAIKWYSINEDATMIWTLAEDSTELAIQALPLHFLYSGLRSVPLHFQCGYENEYRFLFDGFDSFEYPTEFWLEDVVDGNEWISITPDNNEYIFTGYISDEFLNRFFVHFLDPTNIKDKEIDNKIYSSRNRIFLENIEYQDVKIYNMSGEEIQVNKYSNTLTINNETGYYVVKLIMDNNIYSKVVFIKN